MNEWGCGLYTGVGNLLTFVSFCDKNTRVRVICGAGYRPENMVSLAILSLSANDVLLSSPKWYSYFPSKQSGRIWIFHTK